MEDSNNFCANRAKERLTKHLVDTTGLSLSATPFFALMETAVRDMSRWESFETRLKATALGYAGLAFLYSKGRDLTRRAARVNDKTNEFIQTLVDFGYSAIFNFGLHYGLYSHTTNQQSEELLHSARAAALIGAVAGPIGGYAIDIYRDLAGIEECNRGLYPNLLKDLDKSSKRKALAYLSAGLAGVTALTYTFASN